MFCLCEILFNLELQHLTTQVDLQLSNTGNGESLLLTATDYALSLLLLPLWELESYSGLWLQNQPAALTPFDSIPFFLSLRLPLVFKWPLAPQIKDWAQWAAVEISPSKKQRPSHIIGSHQWHSR